MKNDLPAALRRVLPFALLATTAHGVDIGIVNGNFEADAADNAAPPTGWTDNTPTSFWTGLPGETGNPSLSQTDLAPGGIGTYFLTTARQSAGAGSQPTSGRLLQTVDLSSFATDIDGGEETLLVSFIYASNDNRDTGAFSLHFFSSTDGSGTELGSGYSLNLDAGTGFTFSEWQDSVVGGTVPAGARSVTIQIDTTRSGGSETNIWIDNIFGNIGAADSDGDGLPDVFENQIINFDEFDDVASLADVAGPNDAPTTTDYDDDGLSDADEFANETDPTNWDSDADGLDDGPEVNGTDNLGNSHGFGPTDPNLADSDSDGIDDGPEVEGYDNDYFDHGFGPTNPNSAFTDADSLPDAWEILYLLNPNSSSGDDGDAGDPDLDDLDNAAELANGTNPLVADSDEDGLDDGAEVAGTDNEGVSHGFGATDPTLIDSDGDGFGDGFEISEGANPNDNASTPGMPVAFVNGGFEEPVIAVPTEGVAVSTGNVPGWSATVNDFYVIDDFDFANDTGTPELASEGVQFASSDRRAPNPDLAADSFAGGIDASMGMRQDLDVSALAASIDAGARSLWVIFDWFDNDAADEGVITLNFLDGSGNDLGRPAIYRTGQAAGITWQTGIHRGYPPVNTRTVRVTAVVSKVIANTTTARNVAYDNFRASLLFRDDDADGLPDDWEDSFGFDLDPGGNDDADTLTNLQELDAGTNPTLADTDGDGIDDDVELAAGSDPLDATSVPVTAELRATGIEVIPGASAAVSFEGLDPAKTYALMRGTDLQSFPDAVETKQPAAASDTFTDSAPPACNAFYRLEEQ